ncbi:arsenite efflux transporter metallochaperone ArsD [Fodinibius sp.]|uniref:arsenite efflux transporter metallochaperone ArsD n=1 Tax=Fodinibius sp. TaxID=1872440 RepID=UPI002ACDA469|nr:arsenite efflux transporter metallochaperone ArsD [Fodinibius sp.]MDZ7659367.1 arsenite efflux transporter metallochaperone ArsD [Fodinibius sp.]
MEDTQQKTMTLEVFDPAMCCSTGVCGPDVDDELVDFANDVKWLKSQGINVQRYNLGQEPEAFKSNPEVITRLQNEGSDILPIIAVNGSVILEGDYPDRNQLKELLNINGETSNQKTEERTMVENENIWNEQVQELVALSAALASNCETCLKAHYKKAKDLGVSEQTIAQTLQVAQNVKQVPAGNIVELSNKLLGAGKSSAANGCAPGSGCC